MSPAQTLESAHKSASINLQIATESTCQFTSCRLFNESSSEMVPRVLWCTERQSDRLTRGMESGILLYRVFHPGLIFHCILAFTDIQWRRLVWVNRSQVIPG